ncbi:putative phage abortive infection protein [Microbulbifer sp. SA54]|uniref:putative phage abortive infection protein n=1 Tax=Microbulbifer sp. SA54 TaxID=3401577 RepID=UPI003AAE2602
MSKRRVYTICISAILIAALVVSQYFRIFNGDLSENQADWAAFGSFLGGTVGAIFASLSFFALIYTVFLQRKELDTAISALDKSAVAHEQQVKNQEIQKFETTFYSLLEQHNQSIQRVFSKDSDYHYFLSNLETVAEKNGVDEFLKNRQNHILSNIEVSQYFRILYQILKYIAKNNIKNVNREYSASYLSDRKSISENENVEKLYASIVRSFVPVSLLPALALNCIPRHDGLNNLDLFWLLLERYEFLEHMRVDRLPNNLSSYHILNRYCYALGNNDFFKVKYQVLLSKYPDLFNEDLMEGGLLYTLHEYA